MPVGRRLRWRAPRDRVPSSAHAVRFASRAPMGVPAPGALRFVSGVVLVRTASLERMCPMEDDFDEGRPVTGHPPRLMLSASLPEIACGGTRSRCASVRVGCRSVWVVFVGGHAPLRRRFRQVLPKLSSPQAERPRGRRYLPTNPTACGCEEVDAAVPLAGCRVPRLVYEDAPSSSFGRWWPKRDPARRRTAPPHGMTQPPPEDAPLHSTRKLLESRVTLNNIFNTLRWMPSA